VAFIRDGKVALTGGKNGAWLWDAATGRAFAQLPLIHPGAIDAVTFSRDGKAALTGGKDGARLWDAATGRPFAPPLAHPGAVGAVAFSPDGKAVLTGYEGGTARLWDATTGRPLGPPLAHPGAVGAVAFSPDGKAALTGGEDTTARLWDVSELPDDLERISTWIEVITGLRLDELGSVIVLDNSTRRERRDKLETEGGPPTTGPRWWLDPILPILFGPDPTARAKAWIERERWAEAAAAISEAVRLRPDVPAYRHHQILTLLAAGDHTGLRRTRTDMLDRFRMTTGPMTAYSVAWSSVMAVSEEPNLSETVRLAELAVNGAPEDLPESLKAAFLNTLGAALYRAGRFAEAVRRLEEGIQKRKGVRSEADWLFLTLAHHRLGHHDEARRWLGRFRDRRPRLGPNEFWYELEIRLLRAEAEAVVLWDPVFPADPFAN
jgi:tetratricopeptide (TPR) repeat protein